MRIHLHENKMQILMIFSTLDTKLLFPVIIVISLLLVSCDNPLRGGDHPDSNAVGFALLIDDNELFRYFDRTAIPNYDKFPEYFDKDNRLTLTEELLDENNRMQDQLTIRWLNTKEELFDLPPAFENGSRTSNQWELRFAVRDAGSGENLSLNDSPLTYEIETAHTGWDFWLHGMKNGEVDLDIILWHTDHTDLLQTIRSVRVEL